MKRVQRTIKKEVSISGKGVHTGQMVTVVLKRGEVDSGVVFRRVDLYGKPELRVSVELLGNDLVRNTSVVSGHVKLNTIEHLMSALRGMNVDNIVVEMNASEPPIMDGSAKYFVNLLQQAEIEEQGKEVEYYEVREPISITDGSRSIIALPYDGFKVTCTSADDRGIHTQHLSLDITMESYMTQVASARTFTVYEDIEPLLRMGKIQGASLDSAIILKGNKAISKEPLRYKDEFVRHKILDIIGDLYLLGRPLKGHIIAVKTGHALNAALAKAIYNQVRSLEVKKEREGEEGGKKEEGGVPVVIKKETVLDTRRILDILPHRYPFVMVDRVTELDAEERLVAVKNVTINEPYFQGHFPGNPVMPGVMQVEAMAQAAGLLLLKRVNADNRVAYFMSCDKVKFRAPVRPGDQLEIRVKLTKVRESRGNFIGVAEGECVVDGQVVSSAELMFTVAEAKGEA